MTGPNIPTLSEKLRWIGEGMREGGEPDAPTRADVDEARRLLDVLDRIHAAMDGEEWNADTTADVGQILTTAGFVIHEPGYYEDEDEEA